jgi:hypothetical protein
MERSMRKLIGIIISLTAGFSIGQAGAAPFGNPGLLKAAIEESAAFEQVHCVPGWYHHSYGDGCYGGGYYGGGYYGGYRGVYRGYRGVYRGGAYRGYRGGAYRGGAYRGGAAFRGGAYRGGGRAGARGGGGRRSDVRLKHDIALLGYLQNGIPFYRFAYNGSDISYVGVMAQDVQKIDPLAVTTGRDGYLRVHYERLGLKFQTYNQWLAVGGFIPAAR